MKKRLLSLALVFALTATQAVSVSADRKQEVQAQKSATQSKLSEAESKANNLETKKNELMGQISTSQQELVSVIAQIDILDGEIKDKEIDIEETKEDLVEAEADRDEQYEAMKKRIQYLYENGGSDAWAQILLESDSIATMLAKAENTEKMYAYDRSELKKMKEIVQQVTDLETKLEGEKAELESTKSEQEGVKASLQTKVDNLKATASDYESQIATAKAQAQEYKKLIEQQNAELKKIQEEEARAAAEAARKAKEAAEAAKKQQQAQQAAAAAAQAASSSSSSSSNKSSSSTGGSSTSSATSSNTQTSGGSSSSSNSNSSSSGSTSSGGTSSSSNSSASTESSAATETTSTPSYNSATGSAVVAYASQFIGNPYVYGGNSLTNGIDCSGFVQQVFGHFGYSLPRTSDAQASVGTGISYSEARAGDIIVYPGHVAILTGDGGIVHASNSAPYPQGGIKYTSNALYRSYIAVRRIV